jgi:NADH-quinone oxidoreductase subunit C
MTSQEILDTLKTLCGDAVLDAKMDVLQPWISVEPLKLAVVAKALREDPRLDFDYVMCMSGMDYNNGTLGAVYHLASLSQKHKIVLKAVVKKEDPRVASTAAIWGGAEWHEREAYDMVGIVFEGHPDLRRILLPDDYPGHPLRKDFVVPEYYNGMKVPY